DAGDIESVTSARGVDHQNHGMRHGEFLVQPREFKTAGNHLLRAVAAHFAILATENDPRRTHAEGCSSRAILLAHDPRGRTRNVRYFQSADIRTCGRCRRQLCRIHHAAIRQGASAAIDRRRRLGLEDVRRGLQNESHREDAVGGLCQQPRPAGRTLLQSHVPGLRRRSGDVCRSDPGRIFAAEPLAKLQIRIRHARLRVSPRNLATYRSTDGAAGLGYDMVFERAANDPTAVATEMMSRLEMSGMALAGSPADFGTTTSVSCKTRGPRARSL